MAASTDDEAAQAIASTLRDALARTPYAVASLTRLTDDSGGGVHVAWKGQLERPLEDGTRTLVVVNANGLGVAPAADFAMEPSSRDAERAELETLASLAAPARVSSSSPFSIQTSTPPLLHYDLPTHPEVQQLITTSGASVPVENYPVKPWPPNSSPDLAAVATSREPPPHQLPPLVPPVRPSHSRRATDDTTSSVFSDRSDYRVRRSALRRSSSSTKPQSPRQVRFDFAGAEVLPTSSPQATEASHTATGHSRPPSSPTFFQPASSGSTAGSCGSAGSLLGDDSDDDEEPPPKKVSSSQALRALSRTPPEPGTVWTVVNPATSDDDDDDDDDNSGSSDEGGRGGLSMTKSADSFRSVDTIRAATPPPPRLERTTSTSTSSSSSSFKIQAITRRQPVSEITRATATATMARPSRDSDNSSDDEFLSIAKPKSFTNKKGYTSPARSPKPRSPAPASPTLKPQRPTSATKPVAMESRSKLRKPTAPLEDNSEQDDDGDDDMFFFEGGRKSKWKAKGRSALLRNDKARAADDESSDGGQAEPHLSTNASASARPIGRSRQPAEPVAMSPSPRQQVSSIGSYKGRALGTEVVKNQELYDQAAALPGLEMVVGSLDGRTGVDEDTASSSLRASIRHASGGGAFSGTPGSLTQRLMMDEAKEQHQKKTGSPGRRH